jgi:serine O-acetyltransferase
MTALTLTRLTRCGLIDYTASQISHFFPDSRSGIRERIESNLAESLDRLQRCINAVRYWPENRFGHLHSTQYCLYLYFLSNTIWRNSGDEDSCVRLFLLNKALNGIDCFYDIAMPDVFFIGHTVGIVLAKATYGEHLVLYQNSTVGKNHGVAPVIEEGVIMYPNTAIIGRCRVRARTTIAQGVSVINQDTPGNAIAFGGGKDLVFKPSKHDALAEIFRL